MESLSWIFFCLSPFALFCSEDGNGLILCPTFIILGFVFKWIGNVSIGASKNVVKVKPSEFWECHYKRFISSTLAQKETIGDYLMSYKDKEARDHATTMCRYHNAWIPPEVTQEQIARASGVITEQMVEEKDRIQFGKYYLMGKTIKFFEEGMETCDVVTIEWRELSRIVEELKHLRNEITYVGIRSISEFKFKEKFGTYEADEVWNTVLSQKERSEAKKWAKEYMERFKKEEEDKKNGAIIKRDYEYLKKRGFAM